MRLLSLLAFVLFAQGASAAEKIEFAPPAKWVVETPIPAPSADQKAAAVQALLLDTQQKQTTSGSESFVERALLIQTPQGLAAAGSVAMAWDPATAAVTVHRVHILRDGKIIDVLADGRTFTVLRRESNLELAALDGVLTATLQVEGLRVGDTLDVAFSVAQRVPLLDGVIEAFLPALTKAPIRSLHIREIWPLSAPVRWRALEGLPAPVVSTTAEGRELNIRAADLAMPEAPKGAPARFSALGQLELSSFADWSQVSALMQPLYRKAATLSPGSAIKAEALKIAAASSDPKARAAAALQLVQNQVRYMLLGMGEGGYVPADAELTWSRRFGDCKGKTALLLALLDELGIEAQPALISTTLGDGLDARLPTLLLFDHILVRAVIGGKVYWLDGTRYGDRGVDDIATPPFKWALPVSAKGGRLEALVRTPFEKPTQSRELHLDASAGVDAPAAARAEAVFRDDGALQLKLSLDNLSRADAEKAVREFWRSEYDWIEIKSVGFLYDPASGAFRLTMEGVAEMDWRNAGDNRRRYTTDGYKLGWKGDFARDPGPGRDAPFQVAFPYFNRRLETILLPRAGRGFKLEGDTVDKTVAGMRFRRNVRIDAGVFTMETTTQALAPEFPASEAPAAEKALTELSKQGVYVLATVAYTPTPGDVTARAATTPSTVAEYISRGYLFSRAGETDRAIKDFDQAIKLDPKSALAYANRGIQLAGRGDIAEATAAIDKALELDPQEVVAWHARAGAQYANRQYDEAIKSHSKALELKPSDDYARLWRGVSQFALKDYARARDDLTLAVKNQADSVLGNAMLIRTLLALEDAKAAEGVVATLVEGRWPAETYAQIADQVGSSGQGLQTKLYTASIAIQPTTRAYIGRAVSQPKERRADAMADFDRALKLEPGSFDVLRARSFAAAQAEDYAAAMSDINVVLEKSPLDEAALSVRASIFMRQQKYDRAAEDIDLLLTKTENRAVFLNQSCWLKALGGKNLEGALADCNAALKITPAFPAALDSRGFVHLRAGRPQDAIRDYDAALKLRPDQAASLYGRAIAMANIGDKAASEAGFAAARKADPKIDETFADYGVKPQ